MTSRISTSLAAAALAAGVSFALAPAAQAAPQGTSYYLDASAPAGGDGSQAHPWNSLADANAHTFGPGDRLLLDRGDTFTGTLAPHGSGTANAPIRIGAYGSGARPHIEGGGNANAVLLENIQYIEVTDLEITNADRAGTKRNGVRLWLHDFGTGHHYVLKNLDIHDVHGDDSKAIDGSSAVLVSVTGTQKPTAYDDVQIRGNRIADVEREGIYVKSTWSKRDLVGTQQSPVDYPGDWTPSTQVAVADNTLDSIGGDGIKLDTTKGAVVENNRLDGFQLRSKENNAGIWTFNTDDTYIRGNEVSGGGSTGDGMSFDADGGSRHTVFEDNYSHDNKGGFLLICPYSGAKTVDTVVRDNRSVNDQYRVIQTCPGEIRNTLIEDNTFDWTTTVPKYLLEGGASKGVQQELTIRDNTFTRADALPGGGFENVGTITGLVWTDNRLHGIESPVG